MQPVVSFMDLKQQYLEVKSEVLSAIGEVLESLAVSGGPFVEKFEKSFSEYCGVAGTVGCGNGTSALSLAMRALDIGPGDEVIVPTNSFVATAWGPSHVGATPVFADCDPDTWNLDPKSVEAKLSSRTKAIIGVHLYGQPCDIETLTQIARDKKLFFIEDCAQAHGARFNGQRVGGFGELGCFSFYPGKNLGAYGEAGALTSNRADLIKRLQGLRNHGSFERYYHDEVGFNERMDGIQGAILSVKLRHLDRWTERRRSLAKQYQTKIKNPKIKMQRCPSQTESVYHLFVVVTENRDALVSHLREHGIHPGFHYPVPIHLQKAYSSMGYKRGAFPNAEQLAEHCLSIPMYPELKDAEQERVIEALNSF